MPELDGTEPLGYAPSGRGLGPCGRGMAYRRGFGRGRGWKHCHTLIETAKLTKEEEKKILEAELREIEEEKQEIEKKLKELEEKI